MGSTTGDSPRRQIAFVGPWNTLVLDRRNPYTIAFWSIAYAGLGHILLDKYFRGFILLTGEIFLNYFSHMNEALFYTITKQFELARQIVDPVWLALYLGVYCFSIFDGYRETVLINNTYKLAAREDAEIKTFAINANSFTQINTISPWQAIVWSAVLPGSGCFLIQRMNRAFFLISLWVSMAFLSKLYPAIIHTVYGRFDLAKTTLDVAWFLNIPSIWFYSVYEAYACAIENNKLYRWELSKYLKKNYQRKGFFLPIESKGVNTMYVFSLFERSMSLESAITALQMKGIPKESILSVPLDRRNESQMLFDTVHSSDNTSMMALPFITAMIGTLLGSVLGFQLEWGPIMWGFIGAVAGMIVGLGIRLLKANHTRKRLNASKEADVIIIVNCEPGQIDMVHDLLWANGAMGVRKLSI